MALSVGHGVATVARAALAFALPPRCPGCGVIVAEDHRFCLACWLRLDFLTGPACAMCGEPFAHDPGLGARCGRCLASAPALAGMRAAVAYGEIARALALRLKYGGRPGLATTMATLMARHAEAAGATLLVPVPLHRARLWRRGYNQAALIARSVGRVAALPVAVDLIERTRPTPVLRGLGPAARAKAVRGAFRVDARHRPVLKDARVLLIDDVYTTGATGEACARTLLRAGAAEVRMLCWARVVLDRDDADAPGIVDI